MNIFNIMYKNKKLLHYEYRNLNTKDEKNILIKSYCSSKPSI